MSTELTFERGAITFFSGRLTLKEAAAIFAHMPYELDYVNKNDEYVWYSPNPWRDNDRLQKRLTHSVLGCHPKPVQPLVKQVLKALHTGTKDVVESPQVMGSHRVLIRYMQFATLKISTWGIYRLPGTLNGSASFAEPMILNMG